MRVANNVPMLNPDLQSSAKKKRSKTRIFLLVIFCIIIAGLGVAIAILKSPGNNIADVAVNNDSRTEEPATDDPSMSVKMEIRSSLEKVPEESALQYIDERLSEYQGTKFYPIVRIIKMNLLCGDGRPEEALAIAENIDPSKLNEYDLLEYYGSMISIYQELNNATMRNMYDDMYLELNNKLFGEE